MDIFKVLGVGIIGAVIGLFLKESRSEFVIFSLKKEAAFGYF
jgi:hypothetical protein